jgi:hypothetical protein
LQQALWYIDHGFPDGTWLPVDHRWIELAHQWYSLPGVLTIEQYQELKNQIREDEKEKKVSRPVKELVDAFHFNPSPYYVDYASYTRTIASLAAAALGNMTEVEGREQAMQWQLDTAWAILHDQPIPPLEPL